MTINGTPQYSAIRCSGSNARLIRTTVFNVRPISGSTGYSGVLNFRSSILPPSRIYFRLNLIWESEIAIQPTCALMPAKDRSTIYTVSAAATLTEATGRPQPSLQLTRSAAHLFICFAERFEGLSFIRHRVQDTSRCV